MLHIQTNYKSRLLVLLQQIHAPIIMQKISIYSTYTFQYLYIYLNARHKKKYIIGRI